MASLSFDFPEEPVSSFVGDPGHVFHWMDECTAVKTDSVSHDAADSSLALLSLYGSMPSLDGVSVRRRSVVECNAMTTDIEIR